MMTCKEATRLISESLDRRLNVRQRLSLKAHLAACALCKRYGEQLENLRLWFRGKMDRLSSFHTPSPIFLSQETKARIKKALAGPAA